MKDFTLVLHGTEVEPGKPAPNTKYHDSSVSTGNHVTHQDLSHFSGGNIDDSKDSNTQRHNPTELDQHPHQALNPDGSSVLNDHHIPAGSSSSGKPTPILLTTFKPETLSVKKASVDENEGTDVTSSGQPSQSPSSVPVPVKMPTPQAGVSLMMTSGILPEYCLTVDPETSACLGLCLIVLLVHYLWGGMLYGDIKDAAHILRNANPSSPPPRPAPPTYVGECQGDSCDGNNTETSGDTVLSPSFRGDSTISLPPTPMTSLLIPDRIWLFNYRCLPCVNSYRSSSYNCSVNAVNSRNFTSPSACENVVATGIRSSNATVDVSRENRAET